MPTLTKLERSKHMLAHLLLRKFPEQISLKGGYPRDAVLNNQPPNDLDMIFKQRGKTNKTVFDVSNEIFMWSQQHGLYAESPLCLERAGGCRGLQVIVCIANSKSMRSKASSSCEHANKVISIELTTFSPIVPFFSANGLTLQMKDGFSTVDPVHLTVLKATSDARKHQLRQISVTKEERKSLENRMARFLKRGWKVLAPSAEEDMQDHDAGLIVLRHQLDLQAIFPHKHANMMIHEKKNTYVQKFRRHLSQNQGNCPNYLRSGCDQQCGSTKINDCAGICGGGATSDCAGTCNGGATTDCAGKYTCAFLFFFIYFLLLVYLL